ncbi:MAG: tetratricopeptide repeat protein [Terriglobia bacterium]
MSRPRALGTREFAPALRILVALLSLAAASLPSLAEEKGPRREGFQQLAQQAVEAQRQGQGEQAIRLYLRALRLRPEWPEGWRSVGVLLADRKEYARAEAAFQNLLDIEPKNGAGWALLGLCEYEQGRYGEAYKHIQQGQTLGIGNPDLEKVATFHTALMAIQKGDFQLARSLLVRLARSGVDDPDLVAAFGLAALRIAKSPEQLGAEQKSLVDRVGQIELPARHMQVPEVVAAYEKLLAELPQTPGLHYAFGDFLASAGQYDRAIEEMKNELRLNPDDVLAMVQVALDYLSANQAEQALPYAEKAVHLAPQLFATHYVWGWTLYRNGQNDRAIPELERAVKLEPDSARAHYSLSQAYLRAGRKADADRERDVFARLSQKTTPPGAAMGGREYSGTPSENLPSPPEP